MHNVTWVTQRALAGRCLRQRKVCRVPRRAWTRMRARRVRRFARSVTRAAGCRRGTRLRASALPSPAPTRDGPAGARRRQVRRATTHSPDSAEDPRGKLLGLGGTSRGEQRSAQRVARRREPEVRLVVGEHILERRRRDERGDGGGRASFGGDDVGGKCQYRDSDERLCRIDVLDPGAVEARVVGQLLEGSELTARLDEAARARIGGAPRVMPDRLRIRLGDIGRQGFLEDLAPAAEADERIQREHVVMLENPGAAVPRARTAGRRIRGAGGGDRFGAAAFHRRRGPEEVLVVRDVADAVGALRIDLLQVTLVGSDRCLVGRYRVCYSGPRACGRAPACAEGDPSRAPRSAAVSRSPDRPRDATTIPSGESSSGWHPDGVARWRARARAASEFPVSMDAASHAHPTNRTDAD